MFQTFTQLLFRSRVFQIVFVLFFVFGGEVRAQFPYGDSFRKSTAPGMIFGGNPLSSSLTAGVIDPDGDGYLRLTNNSGNQTGYAINSRTFPSSQGLQISFEYYTYGGTQGSADGITFFLFDATAVTAFTPGAFGGSLGYAQNSTLPGVSKGYVGIGIDEFGNFNTNTAGRAGGTGSDPKPSSITLRGDGNGTGPGTGNSNYRFLTTLQTTNLSEMTAAGAGSPFTIIGLQNGRTAPGGQLDPQENGYRKINIVLDPNGSNTGHIINVHITQNTGGVLSTHHVVKNFNYVSHNPPPQNLSYGFASSTGGSNNFHEIRTIDIVVPPSTPIAPTNIGDIVKSTSEDVQITFAGDDFYNRDYTLSKFIDPNGDPLNKIRVEGLPSNGKLFHYNTEITNGNKATLEILYSDVLAGKFSYVPNANFTGSDVFRWTGADGSTPQTGQYAVDTDGAGPLKAIGDVNITVTPVNDAPVAVADIANVAEDAVLTVNAPGILTNDSDVESSPLSVTQYTIAGDAVSKVPGTPVTISGIGSINIQSTGAYTFTPLPNYNGTVPVITYTVSDGALTATSTLTITVTPVNDVPVAVADVNTVTEDVTLTVAAASGLLANDSDIDGNSLIVSQYLIAGDPSPKTTGTPVTITGVGTINIAGDGSYTFAPAVNYTGLIPVITYTVSDGSLTATSTLTLTITAVNDAPIAVADVGTVTEDVTLTVNAAQGLLSNDSDIEGSALSITQYLIAGDVTPKSPGNTVNIPGVGTINIAANGGFTFTPLANYSGPVPVITYTVSDGSLTATSTLTLSITPVNDLPTVADIAKSGPEDVIITFTSADFTGKFTDIDGDALASIRITTLPANGVLKVGGTALTSADLPRTVAAASLSSITFEPAANFNGITTFGWNGSDGTALATTGANVNITITPVNDIPTVADIAKSGPEDATITFTTADFTSKFTDGDGDALASIRITTLPANGLLKVGGTALTSTDLPRTVAAGSLSSITFEPTTNFNGATTFGWNAYDGTALASTGANVNITITPVNDLPIVADIAKSGPEDATITFSAVDFTGKFTDIDGDALASIRITTLPANGALKVGGTALTSAELPRTVAAASLSSITFEPAVNFNGVTAFGWNGSDGTAFATTGANVNITITPVNDAPVANPDAITVARSGTATTLIGGAASVLANDTDVDNTTLTAKLVSNVTNGTLTLNANGTFSYTHNGGSASTDSFTYTVNDGTIDGNTVTVSISITSTNTPPVAVADSYSVFKGGTISVSAPGLLLNDTDADNNTLTAVKVTDPTHGSLTTFSSTGSFTYKHNGDAATSDSFTYKVNDGTVDGNTVTVTIAISAINTPPSAVNDSYSVLRGGTLAISAPGILANDTDPDGNTLNALKVSNPTNGTLTLNTNGSFTYIHNGSATTSDSFSYKVTDGASESSSATVNITVTASNTAPVAVGDTYNLQKGATLNVSAPGLLLNDSDVDGQTLKAIKVSDPANGTLTLNQNGSFTYIHNNGAATSDTFTYKVNDGIIDGNTVTVTLNISASGNNAPVAVADTYSVIKGGTLNLTAPGVLSNDSDPDGNTLSAIRVSNPSNGTLTLNSNGSLTYVHNGGNSTSDSFGYKVNDGTVDGNITTVTINILPVNTPPVAVADSYTAVRGTTLNVAAPGLLTNDTDPEGNSLTAIKVSNPSFGTLTLNPNGSFSYVNNGNASGSDSFAYKVNDGTQDGNTVTVSISITTANALPVIGDISKSGSRDQVVAFTTADFTSKYSDADGDALNRIRILTLPANGTLKLNGSNITANQEILSSDLSGLTFTPTAGFVGGPISFNWNANDGKDYAASPRSVNITIIQVNASPQSLADTYTVNKNATLTIAAPGVLTNDTDAESNALTAIKVSDPLHGTLTFNPNGSFTYKHNGGSETSDSFSYKANDGNSDGNTVLVNITITQVNTPPVVNGKEVSKIGTGFLPITFTADDFRASFVDAEGDGLVRIRLVTVPPASQGLLKLNGVTVSAGQEIAVADLGGLSFEPALNWGGTTNFTWNGSDGTTYATTNGNISVTVVRPTDPNAKIGLAKNLASVVPGLNGTYDVKFTFTVVNYGMYALENVSVRDNLTLAFGASTVTVKSISAFGNLKANTAFTGASDTELLLSTSRLEAGEEGVIELLINLKLPAAGGLFYNSATAEAQSVINGFRVSDVSTNGLKPDPNQAGDVSPSESTPIELESQPSFVPGGFSPNGDGNNDKFIIQNTNGKQVSLEVFNRWGNRVYKSTDYKNDWGGEVSEGFFVGRDIPDGTYYYIIIIDNTDKYVGFITVNR